MLGDTIVVAAIFQYRRSHPDDACVLHSGQEVLNWVMFLHRVGAGRCRHPYSNESHTGTDKNFLNQRDLLCQLLESCWGQQYFAAITANWDELSMSNPGLCVFTSWISRSPIRRYSSKCTPLCQP
jgi:hypothetical protein